MPAARALSLTIFGEDTSISFSRTHIPDNVDGRTLLRFDPVVGTDLRTSAGTVILESLNGRAVTLTLTGTEGVDGRFGTPDDQPFEIISSGTRGRLNFDFFTDQRPLVDQSAFISARLNGSFAYDRSIIRGGAQLLAVGSIRDPSVFASFNAVPGSYDVMRGPLATPSNLTSFGGLLTASFGFPANFGSPEESAQQTAGAVFRITSAVSEAVPVPEPASGILVALGISILMLFNAVCAKRDNPYGEITHPRTLQAVTEVGCGSQQLNKSQIQPPQPNGEEGRLAK